MVRDLAGPDDPDMDRFWSGWIGKSGVRAQFRIAQTTSCSIICAASL
jgi:hypothetical protein